MQEESIEAAAVVHAGEKEVQTQGRGHGGAEEGNNLRDG